MMKLLIASDLHGSAYYAKKLMETYKREGADRLVLLGDILYHGPRNALPREYDPKQVIECLNPLAKEVLCVRGNCDSEVDQMVLAFPMMADYALLHVDGVSIFATHGHLYHKDQLPPLPAGEILLHGHTHVPVCEQGEGYTYLNPGSLSIPKENSPHGYMTFEAGVFTWKTIDGEAWKEYKA